MNLIEFQDNFPDEASCREKFKEYREKKGVTCKKCGHKGHYWHKTRSQFQCKKCRFRTTLRSGTVMQASKLSFRYWFIAMHLLTNTKKSFSAKEVQRQLGHKRYQPIWAMLHKIRAVMGLREDEYTIEGEIELDEGFFETVNPSKDSDEKPKRGRGSQKQTTVLVMAESKEVEEGEQKKHAPNRKVGYLKMKIIHDISSSTINQKVDENINEESKVITDGFASYNKLKEVVNDHKSEVAPKEKACKLLPWVHIAIGNAKRMLLDIHHRIDSDFLQNYLNEFCYKFNRRYFGKNLFSRLLTTCVSYRWNDLGEEYG